MRAWLGATFAAVGVITAAAVYLFVNGSTSDVVSQRSSEVAVGRAVRVADRIGELPSLSAPEVLRANRSDSFAVWAFGPNGRQLGHARRVGFPLANVPERRRAVARALDGGRVTADLPHDVTVVAVPVFRDGVVDGAVLARATRSVALQRSIDTLRSDSLKALALAIVVGVLVGFAVASVITRRIRRLANSAEQMASGQFDTPLQMGGRDEIGDLTRSLDSMRSALHESFNVLTSERDKLSAIFAGLSDAVMVVGNDGEVRFHNPAAQPLMAEDGTSPIYPLVPWLRRAAQRGSADHGSVGVGERVYALQARDLPAEQAVLLVVRDRTEEMRREVADREFVSNAAHELRNPIAGISGAIEVLRSGAKDDPEARDHFLDRLSQDADRMSRLTQSLLALARVQALGEGEAEVVDVAVAADEAAQALGRPDGIDLSLDIESDLAAAGDPVLLRQVLIGLLSNAYKHTPPPGEVTLSAHREGEGDVLVEVTDTGTGIPPEEVDRVFERFYRASGSLEHSGFGLGLAIAKRMVDVMGGEIGARSIHGRGSTFWVRLPVAQPTPTPVA
jgi:signal transduction histidine kinase